MKSSASESKLFQIRSKGEIPDRDRRKEQLSRSKLIQTPNFSMYHVRLMKSSASEPSLSLDTRKKVQKSSDGQISIY